MKFKLTILGIVVLLALVEVLLLAYDLRRADQLTRERNALIAELQASIEQLRAERAERLAHSQEIIDAWAKEEFRRVRRHLPDYRGGIEIPYEVHAYAHGVDLNSGIRSKQERIKSTQGHLQADLRKVWSVTMRLYYLAGNGPDKKQYVPR